MKLVNGKLMTESQSDFDQQRIDSEQQVLSANKPPKRVKGADLRAILKISKVVKNVLVDIAGTDDVSLYTQIETSLQAGIDAGIISMIGILEQFKTLDYFNRYSKGITDIIAYLPFMTDAIADAAFKKTSTLNQ